MYPGSKAALGDLGHDAAKNKRFWQPHIRRKKNMMLINLLLKARQQMFPLFDISLNLFCLLIPLVGRR